VRCRAGGTPSGMRKRPDPTRDPAAATPVLVVATPGVLMLDLAGVAEPFRIACTESEAAGRAAPFALSVAGPVARIATSLPVMIAGLRPLPRRLPDSAWIVVAGSASAIERDRPSRVRAEEAVVRWLRTVVAPALAQGRARVWTVCSGALLAARAGLLDGRQCTTHHDLIERLARECPAARVQANRIFVADGPVATSAGITAGIDLALHAIGERLGQAEALAIARELVVFHRRAGGDPQLSAWLQHRNHLHAAVHRAQDAVLAAPAEPWTVARLAQVAHVTPRHLARLFHQNAGVAPLEYLQRIRLELARTLLGGGRESVESVAVRAGFGSAHHLRRVWRRHQGGSPGAARAG